MTERGFLLTLEGGEGAGKSTMAHLLAADLADLTDDIVLTREPGWGPVGAAIRHLVLDDPTQTLSPRTEALLFAADRAEHVDRFIRPALDRGALVICDRYLDSSVAYQGYAAQLGPEEIAHLSHWGTNDLLPDLTVLIDLDPERGLQRKHAQSEVNRMEARELNFHHQVRAGFLAIADDNPERFSIVDGEAPFDDVYADVLNLVRARLTSTS